MKFLWVDGEWNSLDNHSYVPNKFSLVVQVCQRFRMRSGHSVRVFAIHEPFKERVFLIWKQLIRIYGTEL